MIVETLWKKIAGVLIENVSLIAKNYGNSANYTKELTKLLVELGHTLKFGAVDTEYWPRVDISYFNKCTDLNWDKWAREVAIEIENDATWEQELDKLFCINAGIKVLIAYDDRSDEAMMTFFKKEFKPIYKSRKYHQLNDQYLLIFGPSCTVNFTGRKDFTAFKFDGHLVTKLKSYDIISLLP